MGRSREMGETRSLEGAQDRQTWVDHAGRTPGLLLQDYEWLFLFVATGVGLLWGMMALWVGFSWSFVQGSGVFRAILTLFVFPLHLASWVARVLQWQAIDPSALVVTVGAILGLVPALALLIGARCWYRD
jgi:hypothetical protein